MRVHELAKEMDKTNKEVLDVLQEKNIEVKSHMSSLSEEEIEAVKKSFTEKNGKEEKAGEEAPKKKHIVQVFRPQNSKNAGKMGGNRGGRQGGSRDGRTAPNQGQNQGQGNKPAFHKEKPAQDGAPAKKTAVAAPKRDDRREERQGGTS